MMLLSTNTSLSALKYRIVEINRHLQSVMVSLLIFAVKRRMGGRVVKLTNFSTSPTEGGGSQLQGRVSTLALALKMNFQYVHFPLTQVHHGASSDWNERWENVLDFNSFCLPGEVSDNYKAATVLGCLTRLAFAKLDSELRFRVSDPQFFLDRFPKDVHKVRPLIRSMMRVPEVVQKQSPRHVALHLRVFQPTDYGLGFTSARETNVSAMSETLRALCNRDSRKLTIFYSPEGQLPALPHLPEFEINNSDAITTLFELSLSENLFLAKSSLSYLAGLLSENHVYYQRFWHPPMPDWNTLADS